MAADDMDMPDLEAMAPQGASQGLPDAGGVQAAAADEVLDEEDELELALEAELDEAGENQQEQQHQQQQPQDVAQAPAGTALQDAARAATAASAVLQQEEEDALPLTDDGFIDLNRLTAKQHQRYNT
jgi:hypothetical protein